MVRGRLPLLRGLPGQALAAVRTSMRSSWERPRRCRQSRQRHAPPPHTGCLPTRPAAPAMHKERPVAAAVAAPAVPFPVQPEQCRCSCRRCSRRRLTRRRWKPSSRCAARRGAAGRGTGAAAPLLAAWTRVLQASAAGSRRAAAARVPTLPPLLPSFHTASAGRLGLHQPGRGERWLSGSKLKSCWEATQLPAPPTDRSLPHPLAPLAAPHSRRESLRLSKPCWVPPLSSSPTWAAAPACPWPNSARGRWVRLPAWMPLAARHGAQPACVRACAGCRGL